MSDKKDKRYEKFVAAYVIEQNATKAAIAAGYKKSAAHVAGCRLLKNDKVKHLLAQRHKQVVAKLEETNNITIERVMKELAHIAFLDPRKFFDEEGKLKAIHQLDEETARSLAGMDIQELVGGAEISKDGIKILQSWVKKIKITSKLGALELVGKHLGMFRDKGQDDKRDIFNLTINLGGGEQPKVIEHEPVKRKRVDDLPEVRL